MAKLFRRSLHNIPKEVFKEYHDALSELVGTSHGVYALYNKGVLFYFGKATDFKRRIRQHLTNRQLNKWTHCSLFLTQKALYVDEIESIIVSLANPVGNRIRHKEGADAKLKKELENIIKRIQQEKLKRVLYTKSDVKREGSSAQSVLKKMYKTQRFKGDKTLLKIYKGRIYKATLMASGKIKFEGKTYPTPSAAARAITRDAPVSGLHFWKIQDNKGNWVRLSALIKSI